MHGRQTCIECKQLSPETRGEQTLTTSFGWRLRRVQSATGDPIVEWRCPTCWQRFKVAQQASEPSSSAPPPMFPSKAPRR